MRIFTAVELPDAVRAAIHAAAEPLLRPLPAVRTVAEPNLHVTVRFLGDVEDSRVPELSAALGAAAATVPAGVAAAAGFGAYPNARQPRVVWAGVEDRTGTIAAAERAVSAAVAPLGFPPESRPFSAHVTVARVDVQSPAWRRRGPFDNLDLPKPSPLGPEFPVREVVLCASELTPRGPVYTAVARFPLIHDRT